ncbi:MAG: hypothetical protein CL931_08805 [Deltaproteobacteria bacterium]|nr:hypothetical protein [Deltaproteobacteria bacterium]
MVPRSVFATLVLLVFAASVAPTASAQSDGERGATKAYWQTRYTTLLDRAEHLRATVAEQTELYADANRRNYRRGQKRHIHRVAAEEARDELAEVERELSTLPDEARRQGALPGWFYEVEEDRSAIVRNPALAPEPDDRDEARNPRFVEPAEEGLGDAAAARR